MALKKLFLKKTDPIRKYIKLIIKLGFGFEKIGIMSESLKMIYSNMIENQMIEEKITKTIILAVRPFNKEMFTKASLEHAEQAQLVEYFDGLFEENLFKEFPVLKNKRQVLIADDFSIYCSNRGNELFYRPIITHILA